MRGEVTLNAGTLAPGESTELRWKIRGPAAHEVNLNRPWEYTVAVSLPSGERTYAVARAEDGDPRPGRLFYVLTEDLEPMDSAGYPNRHTGNRNAWLDPEEFRVQLIDKSEALNRIAERYGAKWATTSPGRSSSAPNGPLGSRPRGPGSRSSPILKRASSASGQRASVHAPPPHRLRLPAA